MRVTLDERLADFSATVWKPVSATADPDISSPTVGNLGEIQLLSAPTEGPETESERLFTVIWNSAKPSRWFKREDFVEHVLVLENGQLVGDIGFEFEFVTDPEEANGSTRVIIPWRIE